jgi:hypothetical protein
VLLDIEYTGMALLLLQHNPLPIQTRASLRQHPTLTQLRHMMQEATLQASRHLPLRKLTSGLGAATTQNCNYCSIRVSDRSFRRNLVRYKENGMEGFADRRLGQVSHRCAPVDEVIALADLDSRRYPGVTVNHFYS